MASKGDGADLNATSSPTTGGELANSKQSSRSEGRRTTSSTSRAAVLAVANAPESSSSRVQQLSPPLQADAAAEAEPVDETIPTPATTAVQPAENQVSPASPSQANEDVRVRISPSSVNSPAPASSKWAEVTKAKVLDSDSGVKNPEARSPSQAVKPSFARRASTNVESSPLSPQGKILFPPRPHVALKYQLSFSSKADLTAGGDQSDEDETKPIKTKKTEGVELTKLPSSGSDEVSKIPEEGHAVADPVEETKEAPGFFSTLPARVDKYFSRFDRLEDNKVVRTLDSVGRDYSPSEYPRNVWGAAGTTFARLVFLGTLIYSTYLLCSLTQDGKLGERMTINGNFHPLFTGPQASGRLDLPTLNFKLDHSLVFYEVDSSSMQRIDISDNTGYNTGFQSHDQLVPISTAFTVSQTVDLNSFDDKTQDNLNPVSDAVKNNMKDEQYSASTHSFKESMKVLYKQFQVFPEISNWYNHTAYLYVRMNPSELADLKICQLQIAMYPKGVYDALVKLDVVQEGDYQNPQQWPGLVTSDWTWKPSNWDRLPGKEWSIYDSDRSMLRMTSHLDYGTIANFATSPAWGPLAVNVSNVTSLAFNYVADGIFIDDFFNWEMSVSYVTNMMHTFENITCEGDSQSFDMLFATAKGVINATATELVLVGQVTFPDHFPPFQVLLSSAIDQEEVTVESINYHGNDTVLAITRNTDNPPYHGIDFQWSGAQFVCDPSIFPETSDLTPWTCDPAQYWSNDGCHCDCGAYDPDCCLVVKAEVFNCRNYEVCSPAGNCVSQLVSEFGKIKVSEACDSINYAGETDLVGYIGSKANFDALGGTECKACADDPYYGGVAQLDSTTSKFVCNVVASGKLIGRQNYNLTNTGNSTVSDDYSISIDSAAFPMVGLPYPILISDKEGIEEALNVIAIKMVDKNTQILTVQTPSKTPPLIQHFSVGKLVSAFSADSSLLVTIPHPLDPNPQDHWFSTDGPYSIRAVDYGVTVIDTSDPGVLPFQVLRLQDAPSDNNGYITRLSLDVAVGSTSIRVQPFTWWWATKTAPPVDRDAFPQKFPMIIRGLPDTYDGIEVAHAVSWDPPTWTCETSGYHAGDGCDCNCGIPDPDCLVPSANGYSGVTMDSSVACALDPNACQVCTYCTYPGATCTTIKPTDTTPAATAIQVESSVFYQTIYLSAPLKLDHSADFTVETPVNGSSNPDDDWYSDSDAYDVFTFSSVRMLKGDDEIAYAPSDRINPHYPEVGKTPDPLHLETALFIIPDRPSFNNSDLCPDASIADDLLPIFDENGWRDWEVRPGRGLEMPGCSQRALNRDPVQFAADTPPPGTPQATYSTYSSRTSRCPHVYDLPKNQYNTYCIAEMPPSYELNYSAILPANNKWSFVPNEDPNISNKPEYVHELEVVFYFSHDDGFLEVESKFSDNANNNGDLERDGTPRSYYGALDHFGPGLNPNYASIPASAPLVYQVLELAPDILDTIEDIGILKPLGWPTDEKSLRALVAKFPIPTIEFPLNSIGGDTDAQSLTLHPGLAYYLSANLDVVAMYEIDLLGHSHIAGWVTTVTSTSATRLPLDYFERNECHVIYNVQIRDSSVYTVKSYNYSVQDWITGLGASIAYLGLALSVTTCLHKLVGWDRRADQRKSALEHEKRVLDRARLLELIASIPKEELQQAMDHAKPLEESVLRPPAPLGLQQRRPASRAPSVNGDVQKSSPIAVETESTPVQPIDNADVVKTYLPGQMDD